ncbi:MAG: AAA family ATPase [Isosphaerales bacterium]
MARLHSIRIAGWKSIRDIDPKLELGSINVLIGANGSGKSNFVSFFSMMSELVNEQLQAYIGQWGFANSFLHHGSTVTQRIEAELEFDVEVDRYQYTFHLSWAAPDSLLLTEERVGRQSPDSPTVKSSLIDFPPYRESELREPVRSGNQIAQAIRPILLQCRVFHFHDTSATAKIRSSAYIEANHYLYSDGSNLAAMLYLYQQTKPTVYRRIVATVRDVLPMFDNFVLEPQRLNPKYILLNWKQTGSEYLFGPHQLSDGTLRAMALITLFLQPEADLPAVIILDEPELGLHPHAIEIITGLIRAASLKTQVILATQSTTFLDHFDPEEIIVVDFEQGHSIFRRLDSEELKDWLEDYSVGELWEKNVLGGGPLP